VWRRYAAVDRRDRDDPAPLLRAHVRQRGLRQHVRRRQVQLERLVPELIPVLGERPGIGAAAHPGVVDEDVDRPEQRRGLLDEGRRLRTVSQVAGDRRRLASRRGDLRNDGVELVDGARCCDDGHSRRRQRDRCRASDPSPGPGHEGDSPRRSRHGCVGV
jgi:hypothetical protein